MSETMTRIRLPGHSAVGFMDWGERSAEDMISIIRKIAADHRAQAEAVERAADEDFQVDIVRGPVVQHHVRNIQPGKARDALTLATGGTND